jgi:hypothetical protein
MVKFCSESPVPWEMALRPGEDLAELRRNQFFGYGVDAGMGCFVDAQIIERRSDEPLQASAVLKMTQYSIEDDIYC